MWCNCSKVLSEGTSRRRQIGGCDLRRVIFSLWTVDPAAFRAAGLARLVFAMTPIFSACRGAYRVIYRIDDAGRVVHAVRIDHRADVYRAI
jgi:hypothetical protein